MDHRRHSEPPVRYRPPVKQHPLTVVRAHREYSIRPSEAHPLRTRKRASRRTGRGLKAAPQTDPSLITLTGAHRSPKQDEGGSKLRPDLPLCFLDRREELGVPVPLLQREHDRPRVVGPLLLRSHRRRPRQAVILSRSTTSPHTPSSFTRQTPEPGRATTRSATRPPPPLKRRKPCWAGKIP